MTPNKAEIADSLPGTDAICVFIACYILLTTKQENDIYNLFFCLLVPCASKCHIATSKKELWQKVQKVSGWWTEMVAPGEEMRTTTVLVPSPTLRLLSQEHGASNGRTLGKQNLFKQDVKQATGKVDHVNMMHTSFVHFQTFYTPYMLSLRLTLGKTL